jgi:hypothetical protein
MEHRATGHERSPERLPAPGRLSLLGGKAQSCRCRGDVVLVTTSRRVRGFKAVLDGRLGDHAQLRDCLGRQQTQAGVDKSRQRCRSDSCAPSQVESQATMCGFDSLDARQRKRRRKRVQFASRRSARPRPSPKQRLRTVRPHDEPSMVGPHDFGAAPRRELCAWWGHAQFGIPRRSPSWATSCHSFDSCQERLARRRKDRGPARARSMADSRESSSSSGPSSARLDTVEH